MAMAIFTIWKCLCSKRSFSSSPLHGAVRHIGRGTVPRLYIQVWTYHGFPHHSEVNFLVAIVGLLGCRITWWLGELACFLLAEVALLPANVAISLLQCGRVATIKANCLCSRASRCSAHGKYRL